MSTLVFDTLQYANKLKAAGVPDKQAEVQAEAMAEIIEERLATKKDLKELEINLSNKIEKLELMLTVKFGAMLVIAVGVLAAIIKF